MDLQDVKPFEENLAVEIKFNGLIDRFNDSLVDYLSNSQDFDCSDELNF